MVILTLIEKETLKVCFTYSQMLNISTFGNTADIYVIVQSTKFLRIPKHRMTAHVYRTPYLLLLSPSDKSGQLCKWAFP
jgi:hypothetical protein